MTQPVTNQQRAHAECIDLACPFCGAEPGQRCVKVATTYNTYPENVGALAQWPHAKRRFPS